MAMLGGLGRPGGRDGGKGRLGVLVSAAAVALVALVVGACTVGPARVQVAPQAAPPAGAQQSAPTPTVGAQGGMGHDAAPASAAARPSRDATLPALVTGTVKKVTLEAIETEQEIAPGVRYAAWTYGGTAPGPVIHVRQGDSVEFTLINKGKNPHSMDFHAAMTAPNKNYRTINPGESITFTWKANYPGVYMYHCGTPSILAHIANGMYGAVVVSPADAADLPQVDREYVLVQSEFYAGVQPVDGVYHADYDRAMKAQASYVVFNGYANQYASDPLKAKVGERVRLWVLNAGPSLFSAFHVVGTVFDRAYPDGSPKSVLYGQQTITIPPGAGAMVEFILPEPGNYPVVTHAFADASKGAVGIIKAE